MSWLHFDAISTFQASITVHRHVLLATPPAGKSSDLYEDDIFPTLKIQENANVCKKPATSHILDTEALQIRPNSASRDHPAPTQ